MFRGNKKTPKVPTVSYDDLFMICKSFLTERNLKSTRVFNMSSVTHPARAHTGSGYIISFEDIKTSDEYLEKSPYDRGLYICAVAQRMSDMLKKNKLNYMAIPYRREFSVDSIEVCYITQTTKLFYSR